MQRIKVLFLVALLIMGGCACAGKGDGVCHITASDQAQVWQLDDVRGGEVAPKAAFCGTVLALAGFDGEAYAVKTYDTVSGQLLGTLTVEGEYWALGAYEKGFYLFDQAGLLICYNAALQETGRMNLPDGGQTLPCVNADGSYVLFASRQGEVLLYNTKRKAVETLKLTLYAVSFPGCYEGAFLAQTPTGELYRVKTDGSVQTCDKRRNARLVGAYLVETNRDGYILSRPISASPRVMYGDVNSEYALAASEDYLASLTNEGELVLYDVRHNRGAQPFALGDVVTAVMAADGTTAVTVHREQDFCLYLIRPSEIRFDREMTAADHYVYAADYEEYFAPNTGLTAEEQAVVERIYDTYHVRVFFEVANDRDDVLLFNACTPFTGDRLARLQDLAAFLALSPKDLCRQVTKTGEEVWFMFAHEILEEDHSPSDVAGLTFCLGDHPVVVVETDCPEEMIRVFAAHEFIHLLDYGVSVADHERFEALSPSDGYFGSYQYPPGADMYTYSTEGSQAAFVNAYARTFPDEDRAVTGQTLYESYVAGQAAPSLSAPIIRQKAQLLVSILRETHPCLTEMPGNSWYLEAYTAVS